MSADEVMRPGAGTRMVELSRGEALHLLASVSLGRVGFTEQALPAIRPVNHLVDQGAVVIRTHSGSALLKHSMRSEVVAYEADDIDPTTRTGWSVVVTGVATRVTDSEELARYQRLLTPWSGAAMGDVVRIEPELVTAYRLVSTP
ncbi:nitroimidazol reductase NimA-like FMN-containing flavoprotein (pyridoxamine 5'-phosphate oxidase superfamily) [Streptomyces aurantiacus]|uniref:pyridoxamine 5'-phosphate oxidase family protein n=1 Tax=Streptomyces aurantiacus TaxID=47760 RepID=UPI002793D203|nr:pyridoxamine 5'-phosphate oxidase family protein [Streptomyces aurantiacus]MDQ0779917.1 nitroimidazol reductase NimA-like FMN-containing flavoprotein (pyridoxamine 5'-phosphate oxidase superfamily) [Streptomyces aurantiacus]